MRLVSIAGLSCKVRQLSDVVLPTRQVQKALETQDRMKCFRAVTDSREKPPLELARAEANPRTELANMTIGTACEPLNGRVHSSIGCRIVRNTVEQARYKCLFPGHQSCLVCNPRKSCGQNARDLVECYGLIEENIRRHPEEVKRTTWVKAYSGDRSACSEFGHE